VLLLYPLVELDLLESLTLQCAGPRLTVFGFERFKWNSTVYGIVDCGHGLISLFSTWPCHWKISHSRDPDTREIGVSFLGSMDSFPWSLSASACSPVPPVETSAGTSACVSSE